MTDTLTVIIDADSVRGVHGSAGADDVKRYHVCVEANLPVLLLDVDGPLTDGYVTTSCDILRDLGVAEAYPDAVTTWDPCDSFKIDAGTRDRYACAIRQPGVAAGMNPRPGAADFLSWARAKFRVAALTSALDAPTWAYERERWLIERLGFVKGDVVSAHDKTLVPGLLVDDKPSHVRPRDSALLWDTSYNKDAKLDHIRVRGYDHLRRRLEIILDHSQR